MEKQRKHSHKYETIGTLTAEVEIAPKRPSSSSSSNKVHTDHDDYDEDVIVEKVKKSKKKNGRIANEYVTIGKTEVFELCNDDNTIRKSKDAEILNMSLTSWAWLFIIDTEKWRSYRLRVVYNKQITDLNLQYNQIQLKLNEIVDESKRIRKAYLERKERIVPELEKKKKLIDAGCQIRHVIDSKYCRMMDDCCVLEDLFKQKTLVIQVIETLNRELVNNRLQINELLESLDVVDFARNINDMTKYHRGYDLTESSKVMNRELRDLTKNLKIRNYVADVNRELAASKQNIVNNGKTASDETLLHIAKRFLSNNDDDDVVDNTDIMEMMSDE